MRIIYEGKHHPHVRGKYVWRGSREERKVYENNQLIIHKTFLKCALNPLLRKLQFWTDLPFVIVSKIDDNDDFVGYGFNRMKWLENASN